MLYTESIRYEAQQTNKFSQCHIAKQSFGSGLHMCVWWGGVMWILIIMCNPGKLKRLIEERERIIKEHDTGSVFVENGKVVQGAGGPGGRKAVASEAQQKVSKLAILEYLNLIGFKSILYPCCMYPKGVKRWQCSNTRPKTIIPIFYFLRFQKSKIYTLLDGLTYMKNN